MAFCGVSVAFSASKDSTHDSDVEFVLIFKRLSYRTSAVVYCEQVSEEKTNTLNTGNSVSAYKENLVIGE